MFYSFPRLETDGADTKFLLLVTIWFFGLGSPAQLLWGQQHQRMSFNHSDMTRTVHSIWCGRTRAVPFFPCWNFYLDGCTSEKVYEVVFLFLAAIGFSGVGLPNDLYKHWSTFNHSDLTRTLAVPFAGEHPTDKLAAHFKNDGQDMVVFNLISGMYYCI